MTGLGKGNVARQHLLNIDFSYTENESQTAKKYTGMLEYGYSLLYKFKPVDRFVFMAGLKADALIGFVYNTRNGNNPATPKVNVNLGLSALASYPIYMKDNLILLRYQLSLPFAGVMYAHDYGQSYYEIDMENYKGVFRFASFHNQLMMRNVLSVEFPSKHAYTFKLAYMNNLYETRVNDLDTQWWINSFLIGVSYNFITVPGKKVHSDYYHTIFNQP